MDCEFRRETRGQVASVVTADVEAAAERPWVLKTLEGPKLSGDRVSEPYGLHLLFRVGGAIDDRAHVVFDVAGDARVIGPWMESILGRSGSYGATVLPSPCSAISFNRRREKT